MLIKDLEGEIYKTSNSSSIMHELAKSVYLEEVLFSKKDSKERSEIESMIEVTSRMSVEELVVFLDKHLETRMFLVGQNISAADIVVHLKVAGHFRELLGFQKME